MGFWNSFGWLAGVVLARLVLIVVTRMLTHEVRDSQYRIVRRFKPMPNSGFGRVRYRMAATVFVAAVLVTVFGLYRLVTQLMNAVGPDAELWLIGTLIALVTVVLAVIVLVLTKPLRRRLRRRFELPVSCREDLRRQWRNAHFNEAGVSAD